MTQSDSSNISQTPLRILQVLIWIAGIFSLVWAYFDPRFRDSEGFLEGVFCLPLAAGIALIIFGWAVSTRLRRPAFWFALAVVGQAATLQMIEAGPYCAYQHYTRPLGRLMSGTHPLLIILLIVQSLFVVAGIKSYWADIRTATARYLRGWQLLGIGLVVLFTSASISFFPNKKITYEIPVYAGELLFATFVQTISIGNVFLLVMSIPEDVLDLLKSKFNSYFGRSGKDEVPRAGKVDKFALLAAVWVTVLAAVLSIYSYERFPHIPDEATYLYHAQYFAEGMLSMPVPQVPEAFDVELMYIDRDRWYSAQLPGWPAVLSLGVLLGAPWLVNPLLAGINVLLAYYFMQEIYDRRSARIVVILLCASPWYIFMAMNYMGHTFALTCMLAAAVMMIAARRTGKARWGWISGFFIGMLSLIRPLEAVAIAGIMGLWAIGFWGKRLKYTAIAGLVLGAMAMGSVALYYNYHLTGQPTRFPFTAYTDKYYKPGSNDLGFGPERDMGWRTLDPLPGHGLIDVITNADFNMHGVNTELFGWSTGSIIFIAIMLFAGKKSKSDYLMIAIILSIIGIHSFYWFGGGPDFGARYWYLIIIPGVALSVRGIQYLSDGTESERNDNNRKGTRILAAVLLLCIVTLVNYFPWRAIDKYFHYRGQRPDIRYLEKEYGFQKGLVLINGKRHIDYSSAAVFNPVKFNDDKPVYAWNKSPEVLTQLLINYSDRNVWIVDGPSLTQRGFRVVTGPANALEILSSIRKGTMFNVLKVNQ